MLGIFFVCLVAVYYQSHKVVLKASIPDPKLSTTNPLPTTSKEALEQKAVDLKMSLDGLEDIYENGKKYGYLKKTYDDLKSRYKSKHPKMIEIISELESLTSDSQKIDVVAKEIEQIKAQYSIALQQYEDFLKNGLQPTGVQPTPVAKSLTTVVWKTFGIGFLFLILGLGILTVLDRRIYHPKHILKVQKHVPLLAVTPKLTKREQKLSLHLHHHPTSHYSKSIFFIRNRLLSLPASPRIIGVVSVGKSRGSVSLVANVAISLAQASKKVLLMDCQFYAPQQHRYFKLPNRGVGELLQGDASVAPFNVEVPGLKVLPAGEGLGLKAAGSTQFFELLKVLKEQYDFILIDVPSLSLESGSILWLKKIEGVILTLPRGEITQKTLQWAKTELERYQIQLLGIVLKNAPVFKTHSWNQFLSSHSHIEGRS